MKFDDMVFLGVGLLLVVLGFFTRWSEGISTTSLLGLLLFVVGTFNIRITKLEGVKK